jgi:DNA polymerase
MPKIVTLDLECFYSTEYSLTKIPTEEYVRSPQFEMIGIAIKVDDGETVWYPKPQVAKVLKEFDWSDAMVVAQNTAFDGAVLDWLYGVKPMAWFDTLGMSRALFPHEKAHGLAKQAERMGIGAKGDEVLHAKGKHYADFSAEELARYAEYCINDTELTYTLFNKYMALGFPKQELKLMDMTLRMFIEPVLELDKTLLVDHLEAVKDAKEALMESVRDFMLKDADPEYVHAIFSEGMDGIKKLLMSNDKFAKVLENYGVVPPMKTSLRTGKLAYAFAKTDEEFKALEEHPDERVQMLVAARLGNKTTIEETRTERFIGMSSRGKFPVPLRYYGAHSGRWSGQDSVNLQNLPSRGSNAGKIKKAIKAPKGHVVIDCDSAQIEARTLAWLAGQQDLVEAFENKQDVYKLMASQIYRIPAAEIDKQQRQVGKVVILGAGYGVGHKKLQIFLKMQAGVEVTEAEAKRIIDAYRNGYYKIPELWRRADEALTALRTGNGLQVDEQGLIRAVPNKGLTLPSGLFIQYPDLAKVTDEKTGKDQWRYYSKGMPVYIYGGKVVENVCQAVARQVVGEQMLRIGKKYKVVLTVHDAVACIAPIEEQEQAQRYVEECMSWRPKWAQTLPLACESGVGASYGDC